jgi:uncharacterized protein YqeY
MADTLRDKLNASLKEAMRAKDTRALSTLRLILAALKDRDIASREKSVDGRIGDDELLQMLQSMVKQREESIAMYEQGGRLELAEQENGEIEVIRRFLPEQLSEAEIRDAVEAIITELDASSLKEMGKVMGELRARYPGRMDFGKASGMVKQALSK